MKLTSLLALVACIASVSCASNQTPSVVAEKQFTSDFNPLDGPATRELTASELHAKNVAAITGNPARTLR